MRSSLKRAEPILPAMGKRGAEAVDWYLKHWQNDSLSDEDDVRRETIASALVAIFGWKIDPTLGTKTKYYKWVSTGLPSLFTSFSFVQ